MNKNNKRLRGATLTELVVVLGVLAIISTIVISFLIMSNENVRTSSQKVDALNDIAVVENIMDNWLSSEMRHLSSDFEYFFSEEEYKNGNLSKLLTSIKINNSGYDNILKFEDGVLYSYLNGSEVTYNPETITDIIMTIRKNDQGEIMAMCDIRYELTLSDGETQGYMYSFVVYPYDSINTVIPEVDYEQNN